MTATARDQQSVSSLLQQLKKGAPFSSGLVISVVPRGDLQIAQPAGVAAGLLKAYAGGFSTQDRLTWQTIVKRKPQRASDAYTRAELEKSPYSRELLQPLSLKFALALPLAGPVLDGYPGAAHVLRTQAEGDFSAKEVEALLAVARQFDARRQTAREQSTKRATAADKAATFDAVSFAIVDGKLKPQLNGPGLTALDNHLREQLLAHAKRQMGKSSTNADRVQIPDSHGDVWIFRVVSFKRFPALGNGSYTLICRQPGYADWGAVKPHDLQADSELSRLIPALKFIQEEWRRGPRLPAIAKHVNLSPFHFHRRFTELLGLTPKEYMLDCQIHQCKAELLSGDKDLMQISADCGFAHQSHFTSRFKQATGLTPTRWRRMMKARQASK